MEVETSHPAPPPMEGDNTVVLDENKLHEVISNGSLVFDEWTSLISEIEKMYPDNIEKLCLVYDSFLSEFPLCYGYWRKYASHKMRLCTGEKVVEVFERAVQSATYSVDVWADYCSFGSLHFEDASDVRRLFKRGLSFVGKNYLCHTLWDKFIEFEISQQEWSSLADIYIQLLRFPTKKLNHYYDGFKMLVEIWEKEMNSHDTSTLEVLGELLHDTEVSTGYKQREVSSIIKDLLDPSIGLAKRKALLKYKCMGERLFHEASQLNEKIKCFETRIRRSYFHVKPLDNEQLESWHQYLDFAELHGDFDWAVKLYERCLIPCANYPEFWMRYVDFVECKGGREIANFALDRVTQTFLKRVPAIHMFNARYKELIGDATSAHAVLLQCDLESDPNFVESVVMKANTNIRLGNILAACSTYKAALEIAEAKEKWDIIPTLYVHFFRLKCLTNDDEDAARDVLIDGIKHVPYSKLLLEELIKFAMRHGGSRHLNTVDSIVCNALSSGQGISQGLNEKDREDISRLFFEFVDLCGTSYDSRKAWNRHIRLFPHATRNYSSDVEPAAKKWKMLVVTQKETAIQHSTDYGSEEMVHSPLQKKQSLLENHDNQNAHPDVDRSSDQSELLTDHDILSDQVSDQKSPLLENCNMPSDRAVVDPPQLGECDNIMPEGVHHVPEKVPDPAREDASPLNYSLDSVHQTTDQTEGAEVSVESSKENVLKEECMLDCEQDLKPSSLERLSMDSHDIKSPDPVAATNSEALHGTHLSDGRMQETDQNATVDRFMSGVSSPVSTRASVSPQINVRNVSPSSASNHNTMVQALPQTQMPVNTGKNWRQRRTFDRSRRDSTFGFHEHSHKQQQPPPQQQYPQAEVVSQMAMNQGYPSQPLSSQNPQVQQGSQVRTLNPVSSTHSSLTETQAWSMQNVRQQNVSPASLSQPPVQAVTYPQAQISQYPSPTNQQPVNMPNNQAYNQMWQYYYYQQQQLHQQFLLQQQQLQQLPPQQQQLFQSQLQQQMQLQLQYFQQQLQQLPYQQQQLFQQQTQLSYQQQQIFQQQPPQPPPPQQQQHPQLLQQTQQQQFMQQQMLYLQQQHQQQVLQPHQHQDLQRHQQQLHNKQQTSPPQQQREHEQRHQKQQTETSKSQDRVKSPRGPNAPETVESSVSMQSLQQSSPM